MQVENKRPNIIAIARGDQSSETKDNGIRPITVVVVVRKIGRSREMLPSTITSVTVFPGLIKRKRFITSIKIIELLTIIPARAINPIIDVKESALPVIRSPKKTPIKDSGSTERTYNP